MARSGARRRRRRGVGPAGRGALGRAAPGGAGDALRRPARPRPARRGGRRARAHDRRAPAARGVRPPPDDRPLPQRPPGRRAARVLAHAGRARRRARPRSDARAVRPADGDPQPRSRAWPRPCRCRRGVAAVDVTADRAAGRSTGAAAGVARRPARTGRARRCRRVRRPRRAARPPARLWSTSLAGGSHIALLVGEAGAGKSRLAARFAADVHELGAIVLWGRATAEAIVPFEPMVEAMRTVLRTVSPEARRRVAAERGLLQLLLPELEQLVPGGPVRAPRSERRALPPVRDVAELLRTESSEHPMLIVLDDLHWADAPSLKMIEHVLRHELPGRVMVVATVRSPADEPTPELDRVAAGLARDGLLDARACRSACATDSVAELLRMSGRDAAGAAELCAATGGNAFFLTELIRHTDGAIGSELPGVDPGDDRPAPRPPRSRRRPGAQPGRRRRARRPRCPCSAAASGLDGDELLDATDAAVAAGLLVEDGAGRLAMPHALIGQAIRAGSGGPAGSTCTAASPRRSSRPASRQSSPSMLAHHLLEAGSLVERERARRGRAGRRPELARHRRLRGRRGVGRAGRRARHRPGRRPRPGRAGAAALRHGACRRATAPRPSPPPATPPSGAGRPATRCSWPGPPRAG